MGGFGWKGLWVEEVGGGVFGGAEEKPSLLITENRSSLLIRAAAFPSFIKAKFKCRKMQVSDPPPPSDAD